MYRYQRGKSGSYRAQCLPYGCVRLVDAQYLPLFIVVDMIGNDGIDHGVTQAIKQTVNTNTAYKGDKSVGKARNKHGYHT